MKLVPFPCTSALTHVFSQCLFHTLLKTCNFLEFTEHIYKYFSICLIPHNKKKRVIVGEQSLPLQSISFWHKGYSGLIIFQKLQHRKALKIK